jgi:hypothetical protein
MPTSSTVIRKKEKTNRRRDETRLGTRPGGLGKLRVQAVTNGPCQLPSLTSRLGCDFRDSLHTRPTVSRLKSLLSAAVRLLKFSAKLMPGDSEFTFIRVKREAE